MGERMGTTWTIRRTLWALGETRFGSATPDGQSWPPLALAKLNAQEDWAAYMRGGGVWEVQGFELSPLWF